MNSIIRSIVILSLLLGAGGCASTRFGRGLPPENAIALIECVKGKDKESIIKTLGDPDFTTSAGGSEFWGYHRNDSWCLNLYYGSAGRNWASDLVVKLRNSIAMDAFVIGKGSSLGIISSPLSRRD